MRKWETVAGLEVHVELSTASKIFCGCTTRFGGDVNTHVCPVCMGMPGSLPVLNQAVVDFAIRAGLALNCQITRENRFDRKNYFYPDLPKAYQISQLYLPICQNGFLEIETDGGTKRIGIREIHMEEDAGKLMHDPWDDLTRIDYNRCGVPLLEIVSEPDFSRADEVLAYLEKLRETLLFLKISDCKMQEGSMRADVNVSVRPVGSIELGTRTELKNMSSLKAIHRAVLYEARRQIDVLESGGRIVQETRRWDENKDASFSMRSKENAQDYRYFPEPDLPPVLISEDWLEEIRAAMPESAQAKRARYMGEWGLPEYDARVLTAEPAWAEMLDEITQMTGEPKEAANLIMGDIMRLAGENGIGPEALRVNARKLSRLILLIIEKKINRTVGREVTERIFHDNADPDEYVRAKGLLIVRDENAVSDAIDAVLAANQDSVEAFRGGKEKVFAFLVGQVMKALKGKADPQLVNVLLKEKLSG